MRATELLVMSFDHALQHEWESLHSTLKGLKAAEASRQHSAYAAEPHDERCCCRSGDNANANNAAGEGTEEGFRVVPIGTDGRIVYDPADAHRHHSVCPSSDSRSGLPPAS